MADFYQKKDIEFKKTPFKNEYELLDTILGEGTSGQIYTCKSFTQDKVYALKSLEDDEQSLAEILFLQKCENNDHIISLKDVFYNRGFLEEQESGENYFYLVMEKMDADLWDKTQQGISEANAAYVAREIVFGMSELHQMGIIHRDIKLENILVKSPPSEDGITCTQVKIGDLGLAVEERKKPAEALYTHPYGAPEIIMLDPFLNEDDITTETRPYDRKVDTWSFGVLVYMMLSGLQPPFKDCTQSLNGDVDFTEPCWSQVSDEAKNLIYHILRPDPSKRPSLDDILLHPWFKQADELCKTNN